MSSSSKWRAGAITDVAGIEVGHHTDSRRPTGCTVVIARDGAVAGVDPQVRVGQSVQKGDWIGRVGNSGTAAASQGSGAGPRLLFEHWSGKPDESDYFGKGLARDQLVSQARQRYTAALR